MIRCSRSAAALYFESAYFARGYTPKVKPGKHCNACSLKALCLPVLCRRADPNAYLREHLEEPLGGTV